MSEAPQPVGRATPLDYLRLCRLPNLFTAGADVTMGYLFVQPRLQPPAVYGCLLLSSGALYTAGMVLNDVYDVEEDRLFRPDRPLPSGRIPLGRAQKIGYGLLVIGLVAGWLAGYVLPQEGVPTWRSGAIVTGLAACVWLYDAMLKATPAGPILMGACRLLNVLLGMSVAAPYVDSWNVFGYGLHHGIVAGGIGLYITGVAWFARGEAETSSRGQLLLATLVMVTGIGVLGTLHRCLPLGVPRGMQSEGYWLLLLALLAFTIVRRCIVAVVEPEPALVQAAVKHGILSLIVLDAAVTVEVSSWYYAFWLLMLLIPSTLLGKWVYST